MEQNKQHKILLTGGTGFLGAYILKELVEQGYSVRALRRTSKLPFFLPAHIFDRVEWVEGDLLDIISLEEAMDGIDTVIHAAAKVSFDPADKQELFRININGTANVVNAALICNIRRLVYISSVAALGRSATGDTVNEEKKWQKSKTNTWYAISKFQAEREVWRGMGEGLDVVVLNPSTILGYGDWKNSSAAIFRNVYQEFPWYTNGVNGFVDVEDVARATVRLMESDLVNQQFIVSGDNWPFRQLFNSIADAFGKKQPAKMATPFLGSIAWRLEKLKSLFTGKRPLLTRQSAKVAQSKTYFDNSKILSALPGFSFTPLQVSVEKACRQYHQYLSNGGQ
ncbi:MAG: NAD-dependent epimerase/dehydratase family protein [Candidatus Pseudobacter hemicellulosilyticus]|uniref:NAD-dependent epimerase/dehydratase family protein n=1 Tax=Candidatus Pseudobacter hemicellulosilyticus TaxID=3121375 RepID=A0AAJ5WV14_9BACT|nr:MAG: NAD-dependent epimerase/dehydratase family protein [Pseudobacter sp.]